MVDNQMLEQGNCIGNILQCRTCLLSTWIEILANN